MKSLVAILMSVLLAASAFSGCCWSHALAILPTKTATPQVAQQATCCCGNSACKGQHKRQSPKPTNATECRGVCTYLSPQKTQVDATQLAMAFDGIAPLLAYAHEPSRSSAQWTFLVNRAASEPPLRLHLLHQIFLI